MDFGIVLGSSSDIGCVATKAEGVSVEGRLSGALSCDDIGFEGVGRSLSSSSGVCGGGVVSLLSCLSSGVVVGFRTSNMTVVHCSEGGGSFSALVDGNVMLSSSGFGGSSGERMFSGYCPGCVLGTSGSKVGCMSGVSGSVMMGGLGSGGVCGLNVCGVDVNGGLLNRVVVAFLRSAGSVRCKCSCVGAVYSRLTIAVSGVGSSVGVGGSLGSCGSEGSCLRGYVSVSMSVINGFSGGKGVVCVGSSEIGDVLK